VQALISGRCAARHNIAREEIFGPVCLRPHLHDEDEAVATPMDTDYGLSPTCLVRIRPLRGGGRSRRGASRAGLINGRNARPLAPFGGYRQFLLGAGVTACSALELPGANEVLAVQCRR